MDDLRVPDELQGRQPRRAGDVVLPDRILVAVDRDEDEVVDPTDRGQRGRDRRRLRKVEDEAGGSTVQARHRAVHRLPGLARQDDLATRLDVVLCDLEPDRPGPADDDDGSLVSHSRLLQRPAPAGSGAVDWPGQASTPRSTTAAQDDSQR